jgi:hypothetical protein
MSELTSDPISPVDDELTEGVVNGMPLEPARGRHRSRWGLFTGIGWPETPRDRNARLRVLAASAIGVGCLFLAYWLAPAQGSLFVAPSGGTAWIAMILGVVGAWLVPGFWLSAVMMRFAGGSAAWLGARLATMVAWYALLGPVFHHASRGATVTTLGLLTVTAAATGAACVGVALGLSPRPAGLWQRILMAVVIGGGAAQVALWLSTLGSKDDEAYSYGVGLDLLIVGCCALLVVVGMLSRPKPPAPLTARNVRTPLVALAVIAVSAAALLTVGAKWSPAQQMPSAMSGEQIPAPVDADLAFALTAIGPTGSEFIQHADFTIYDEAGQQISVQTRLQPVAGDPARAELLVMLPRSSQPELCGKERMERAVETGAPIKVTARDKASGLVLQAVIPVAWCAG